MKHLSQYIQEKLEINKDSKIKKPFNTTIKCEKNDEEVTFDSSRKEVFNKCFDWLTKHCKVSKEDFEHEKRPFKVDKALYKTNKYELNSVLCYIYPLDKELNQSSKIKGEYSKLLDRYKDGLNEDQIFGYLVPIESYQKSHNAYGELIFTNKGILWNYIDDYALKISNENLVK